jgi:hypothetical protein
MTIRTPQGPAGGRSVIAAALADIRGNPEVSLALAKGAPEALDPIRTYTVDLGAVVAGDVMGAAKPAGWSYLVTFGDGDDMAIAELSGIPSSKVQFQSLTRGHIALRLAEALRVAEQVAGRETAESDVRLLDIPPIYISAVWLHGKKRDRFIPFLDESRKQKNFNIAVDEKFLQRVATLAEQRFAASSTADPTAG